MEINIGNFKIDQSTLAGGIAGLIACGAAYGLTAAGIPIPQSVLMPFAVALVTAVVHFVPDAAKIDEEVKAVAKVLPTTEAKYNISKNKPNL